jgi:hypothetical protein
VLLGMTLGTEVGYTGRVLKADAVAVGPVQALAALQQQSNLG